MTQQFRNILCPVDFDDNSMEALDTAANFARENKGTVFVLHVVPMILAPTGMPVYVDLYKGQEEAARAKLLEIAHKRLAGVKYELLIHTGEPAGTILNAEKKIAADVLASEIVLTNGLSITCFPCTLKSLRGWSIPCGVMDELAFFRLEDTPVGKRVRAQGEARVPTA